MYSQYWNLESQPFENNFDSQFFVASRTHKAALLKLQYLVENNKGCGVLVGGSGAGKSFMMNLLADGLDDRFSPLVHVHFPIMNSAELVAYLASHLSGDDVSTQEGEFHRTLQMFEQSLQAHAQAGRHPVIVIDEAHLIEQHDVFQAIQLLLNYRQHNDFSMILVGQRGLLSKLARVKELEERIAARSVLQPFTREETTHYILQRLNLAGLKGEIFDSASLNEIHALSGGVPRQINRIADLSLLVGFADGLGKISVKEIASVADEAGCSLADSELRIA